MCTDTVEGVVLSADHVAEKLLRNKEANYRDCGRHRLMASAVTESDWQILADRFAKDEIADLRQKVLEHFLRDCPDGAALRDFVDSVMGMWLSEISSIDDFPSPKQISYMHWALTCLERIGDKERIDLFAQMLRGKFGPCLPRSVRRRLPARPSLLDDDVFARRQPPANIRAPLPTRRPESVVQKEEPIEEPMMAWKPREIRPIPVIGIKVRRTNKEIADEMRITTEQVVKLKKCGKLKD